MKILKLYKTMETVNTDSQRTVTIQLRSIFKNLALPWNSILNVTRNQKVSQFYMILNENSFYVQSVNIKTLFLTVLVIYVTNK